MKLEDFNNIDINNAGNLPLPVKAVLLAIVFVVVLALGYYLFLIDALTALDTAKSKEKDLRQAFLDKKSQSINLAAYKQQKAEIEKTFGALLKQLPNRSQMDGLLTDINQAGLARGLEFELFKPGLENQTEFYAEMPISIRVIGTYHDLGTFATDISKLSRIVTLNDISITTKDASKDANAKSAKPTAADSLLVMEAIAKTYRYLDAEEIAEKRKAEKAAKDKLGGKS